VKRPTGWHESSRPTSVKFSPHHHIDRRHWSEAMLPFLTLAFIGGLTLGSLVPYYPVSISIFLCLVALGFSCLEARRPNDFIVVTASLGGLLFGMIYWFLTVEGRSEPAFEPQPSVFESCTGRVVAPVQYSAGRMVIVARCDREDARRPFTLKLTWRAAERHLFQGDRIGVRARLRLPSGSLNPGGFDYAAYLERQGIDAVATSTALRPSKCWSRALRAFAGVFGTASITGEMPSGSRRCKVCRSRRWACFWESSSENVVTSIPKSVISS
jgi:predicted membrane metal-binding protein